MAPISELGYYDIFFTDFPFKTMDVGGSYLNEKYTEYS